MSEIFSNHECIWQQNKRIEFNDLNSVTFNSPDRDDRGKQDEETENINVPYSLESSESDHHD